MNGTIKDPVDLGAVGVFAQVAELASFRRAAEALGVPRSTVSRRVADLERQLATRLLQRTTRRVALTDAGAAYLRACQPALGAIEDAARAISSGASAARGRLRVTAAVTFGERFLGPVVADYLDRNPEVSVDVVLTDRQVDLVQEGFDLAFRGGRVGDPSLVAREIGRGQLRCFASEAYLARRGRPRTPRDLERHDCVLYAPLAPGGRWTFRAQRRAVTVAVRGRVSVNSLPLALEAALHGLGVARLPGTFAVEEQRRGRLVEVLPSHAPHPTGLFLLHPSGHVPARVRAFIEIAMRHLAKSPWALAR